MLTLPYIMGVDGVWWCFPIAELISLFICLFYYRKINREALSKL